MRSVANFPSDAPALAAGAEAIPSLPSGGDLRGAAAVRMAEFAVLLFRGTVVGVLLAPALLAALLLAG
jgi:hypothetical protein